MLLPYLQHHTAQVVRVLERLIVYKPDDFISDGLARALSEITFMPAHPALGPVHDALRGFVQQSGLAQQLKSCTRGLAHESAAVRLMALQQLLDALQRAPSDQAWRGYEEWSSGVIMRSGVA